MLSLACRKFLQWCEECVDLVCALLCALESALGCCHPGVGVGGLSTGLEKGGVGEEIASVARESLRNAVIGNIPVQVSDFRVSSKVNHGSHHKAFRPSASKRTRAGTDIPRWCDLSCRIICCNSVARYNLHLLDRISASFHCIFEITGNEWVGRTAITVHRELYMESTPVTLLVIDLEPLGTWSLQISQQGSLTCRQLASPGKPPEQRSHRANSRLRS